MEHSSATEKLNDEVTNLESDDAENQQPLSLLALHDEEDLINLSSAPLRPSIQDSNLKFENVEKVFIFTSDEIYNSCIFHV